MNEKGYISAGMGVNTVAMIILMFERGQIMPVVFADTGSEMPETYEYIEYFKPWMKKRYGQELLTLSPQANPGIYWPSTIELPSLEVFCATKRIVPSIAFRWCTDRYKSDPMNRWAKAEGMDKCYKGIDAGEKHRADGQDPTTFPLIEAGITREVCLEVIKGAGIDPPIKSGCFFCPYQGPSGFKALKRKHPEHFYRALDIENNSLARRKEEGKTMEPLIPSGPTLDYIERQGDLWEGQECDFTDATPCECMT